MICRPILDRVADNGLIEWLRNGSVGTRHAGVVRRRASAMEVADRFAYSWVRRESTQTLLSGLVAAGSQSWSWSCQAAHGLGR